MNNDGSRDFCIAQAWTDRKIQKLLAASEYSNNDLVFWFTSNSKEEDAPPPDDQVLALQHLENQEAIRIGMGRCRNELHDRVVGTGIGIKPDGYEVSVNTKKVCRNLREAAPTYRATQLICRQDRT